MLTGIYGNPEITLTNAQDFLFLLNRDMGKFLILVRHLSNYRVSSGKGVLATLLIRKSLFRKVHTYSNFKINVEHPQLKPYADYWHFLKIDGLHDLEEKGYDEVKIFVDEAKNWIESRISAHDEQNQYVDDVLALSRHNNEDWVLLSQLKSMLDKRFRLMSTCEIWCADRRLHNLDGTNCTDDFHYAITNTIKVKPLLLKYKKVIELDLFNMYNTKEKILSPHFESLQFRMNEGNREKLNVIIDGYVELCLKEIPYEYKNITQYQVKDTMLRLNLPLDYVSYVYARIKSRKQQKP